MQQGTRAIDPKVDLPETSVFRRGVDPTGTPSGTTAHLRVLIANERKDRLEVLAQEIAGLGHEVIVNEGVRQCFGDKVAEYQPDLALVALGSSAERALDLIADIVARSQCPVIALLSTFDPAYVHEAAERGAFTCIVDTSSRGLRCTFDITLQRFSEYQNLQEAFRRRTVIEQAKGILMAHNAVNADKAFEMLREHSQHSGYKLKDVAKGIVESHQLIMAPIGAVKAV